LLYLGFVGTLFCYFVSIWAQKHVDTVTVALIFTLEPVFAALFAWIFASESFSLKEMTGGFIILGGIVFFQLIANRKKKTGKSGLCKTC
jgi:drug/metabolite transporter (DMT)-like permease